MKKYQLGGLCITVFMLLGGDVARAINNNQSAGYSRTLNRNASTEVDAAFFNPAGLAFLASDGLHIEIANQSIFQTKKLTDRSPWITKYHPEEYQGDISAPFFPTAHVAYKKDKWVGYFHFGPVGGGGGGEFKDGLPAFDAIALGQINAGLPQGAVLTDLVQSYERDLRLEGTAVHFGFAGGVAYRVSEIAAVSYGYRLTYGYRSFDGHLKGITTNIPTVNQVAATFDTELDIKSTGSSHAFIWGFHLNPIKELNIGIRAEYNTRMVLINDTEITTNSEAVRTLLNNDPNYGDEKRRRFSEPWLLGLGISYSILPELIVASSMTFSLDRHADLKGAQRGRENAVMAGLALEYVILPNLRASIGWSYDTGGYKPEGRDEIDYGLAVNHVAAGVSYDALDWIRVTLGYTHSLYSDSEDDPTSQIPDIDGTPSKQDRSMTSIDIGVGVAMFFN